MTTTESNTSPMTRYRWVICALLFFATTINYIDRQILALIKGTLDTQLHWTNEQYGDVNAAFQAAYGVSLFCFGYLVDRFGSKRGYIASISLWSFGALSHAFVNSISGFIGARIFLGLGEGGNFPAAIKTTSQWFPKKERAFSTSLWNSGSNVAAIIAPALIPPIASTFGWHAAFIFAGFAGFAWLLLWIPLFDYPERSKRVSSAELLYIESDSGDPSIGKPATWMDVLGHRQAWSFIAAKFFTDPVWWFFLIWLPDFFKKTKGLDIKNSWPLLVSIYSIITVLSIIGGWFSGWMIERGSSVTSARKTAMLVFALCVVPIALVTKVDKWTAVLLLGLAGAAHQAWSATIYTTTSDMFPKRMVAKLVGVGSAAGSLGGYYFPKFTGHMLDKYQNGYTYIFAICASAYLVAFVINHILAPSFAPIKEPELHAAVTPD